MVRVVLKKTEVGRDMDELEAFKEEIIKGYVDPYLDRLLDLRNILKGAQSFNEISEALEHEKGALNKIARGSEDATRGA